MTERDYLTLRERHDRLQLYAASLQGLLSGMTEAERNMLATASIYQERLTGLAWEIAQKAYGEQNK